MKTHKTISISIYNDISVNYHKTHKLILSLNTITYLQMIIKLTRTSIFIYNYMPTNDHKTHA